MIGIEHITTNEDFNALEEEWNPLLRLSPVDDAFLTWEWIHTWWKHYGHSYKLYLLIAREDHRLVGIAPLMLEIEKVLLFKIRVLRNIGIPPPDVGGIIIQNGREDILQKIALWLVDNRNRWDVLQIGEIPPGGIQLDTWIPLFSKRKYTSQVDTTRHFYIPMDGNWLKYKQRLPKGLQKDVIYLLRRLQSREGYRYDNNANQDTTIQDMETIFQINQNAHHVYLYRDRVEQEFHKELAILMAAQGWLDIHFLYIGDAPAAFYYGFCYNKTLEFWRTGFVDAYHLHSPGKILLYLLIEDGFEHGIKALDFLQGDEDYKLNWQVETRHFQQLRLVRNVPLPWIAHIFYPRCKKHVRSLLSRHAALRPLLRRIEHLINTIQNMRVK